MQKVVYVFYNEGERKFFRCWSPSGRLLACHEITEAAMVTEEEVERVRDSMLNEHGFKTIQVTLNYNM